MKVFKFGGASIKSANAIKNVAKILNSQDLSNCLLVISAMGKMTNAFDTISINNDNSNAIFNSTSSYVIQPRFTVFSIKYNL